MINLEKEIREQPEALARVLDTNLDTIREIVAKAKAAGVKSIYFAARGTSDHACVYAQYLFGILAGVPCTLGTPSVFTKYGAHIDLSGMLGIPQIVMDIGGIVLLALIILTVLKFSLFKKRKENV